MIFSFLTHDVRQSDVGVSSVRPHQASLSLHDNSLRRICSRFVSPRCMSLPWVISSRLRGWSEPSTCSHGVFMVPQFSPAAAIAYVNVESARRFVRTRPIAEGMAQTSSASPATAPVAPPGLSEPAPELGWVRLAPPPKPPPPLPPLTRCHVCLPSLRFQLRHEQGGGSGVSRTNLG